VKLKEMLSTNCATFIVVSNVKEDIEEELVDESEYYAWNEMRLHPLLMKSIYRLEFKEPTPIQKACIPAAAHQGKVGLGSCLRWCMGVNDSKFKSFYLFIRQDVIGAAETGSGKTLAFGLPILQRLLEEQEKAGKMLEKKGEEAEKYAPKGFLRALIITPTRELALQVLKCFRSCFCLRHLSVVHEQC
jgi:ATP-dependent RNA helicase DDX24/MAK5